MNVESQQRSWTAMNTSPLASQCWSEHNEDPVARSVASFLASIGSDLVTLPLLSYPSIRMATSFSMSSCDYPLPHSTSFDHENEGSNIIWNVRIYTPTRQHSFTTQKNITSKTTVVKIKNNIPEVIELFDFKIPVRCPFEQALATEMNSLNTSSYKTRVCIFRTSLTRSSTERIKQHGDSVAIKIWPWREIGELTEPTPSTTQRPKATQQTQHNVHSVLLLFPASRGSTPSLEMYISETCKWNLSSDCLNNSRLWPHDAVSCEADLTDVKKKGDV